MSLRPCLSCTRHVRSTEVACPFCGADLPDAPVQVPRNVAGLGRAAIMAFGVTAAGCDVDAMMGGYDAAYGGPPVDAAMVESDAATVVTDATSPPDATFDAGGTVAAYGAPPEDAGGQVDSGGGIGPLYGGAP